MLILPFMLLCGCAKEDGDGYAVPEGRILLKAEKIDNKTKVAINGTAAEWVDGDEIYISGEVRSVTLDGSNATISGDELETPYRAVYPASIVTSMNLSTGSTTVELPDQYTFQENAGHTQLLPLPMAAYAASGNSLEFKHLTAALIVRVTNSFGSDMQLREILLQSDLSQISGTRTIDISSTSGITSQSANDVSVTDEQKQVRMLFPSPLTIADGGHRDIMIPVCPVSTSNKFTVTLAATNGGNCYTFSHTQQGGESNTDRSLGRNQLGYVPVAMSNGGDHIQASTYIDDTAKFRTMVTTINNASSGTLQYTIDGTIDYNGGNTPPSLTVKSGVTLIINGINNATLKNMDIAANSLYCGLFRVSNGGSLTISNLTVEDIQLHIPETGMNRNIGGLISYTDGTTALKNCIVRDVILPESISASATLRVGGIVATTYTHCSLYISNCIFERENEINLSINCNSLYFGCIIGYSDSYSNTINNCKVSVNNMTLSPSRTTAMDIGGLAGNIKSTTTSTISNCTINNYSNNGYFNILIDLPDNYNNSGVTHHTGGLFGAVPSDTYNHQLNNNSIKASITENKSTTPNTWVGCMIGLAGYSSSNGSLSGSGNTVNESSIILTGLTGNSRNTYTGNNTDYDLIFGAYNNRSFLPTTRNSFVTGSPTCTGRSK